jgi:hypothetical protein
MKWKTFYDHENESSKDCANDNGESMNILAWWMFKEIITIRHEDFI